MRETYAPANPRTTQPARCVQPVHCRSQPNRRGCSADTPHRRHRSRRPIANRPPKGELEQETRNAEQVIGHPAGRRLDERALMERERRGAHRSREREHQGQPAWCGPTCCRPSSRRSSRRRARRRSRTRPRPFPFYGYDGDGPMLPAPGDVQTPTHNVEATQDRARQEHLPRARPRRHGADAALRLRPRTSSSRATRLRSGRSGRGCVHLAHQPGRGRRAPRDAARRPRHERRADPDDRRLDLGPVRAAAPVHDRGLERAAASARRRSTSRPPSTTSRAPSATRGYEGIQNDADGNLWLVEDVGGADGRGQHARAQPNSFVYRFVPNERERPHAAAASCRCCR